MQEKITDLIDIDVAALTLDQAQALQTLLMKKIVASGGHVVGIGLDPNGASFSTDASNLVIVGTPNTEIWHRNSSGYHLDNSLLHVTGPASSFPSSVRMAFEKAPTVEFKVTDASAEEPLGDARRNLSEEIYAYEAFEMPLPERRPPENVDEEADKADWDAVKAEVLRILQADLLDKPETHLAYIRDRIGPILEKSHVGS